MRYGLAALAAVIAILFFMRSAEAQANTIPISQSQLNVLCQSEGYGAGPHIACASRVDGRCVVYVLDTLSQERKNEQSRAWLARCNGNA